MGLEMNDGRQQQRVVALIVHIRESEWQTLGRSVTVVTHLCRDCIHSRNEGSETRNSKAECINESTGASATQNWHQHRCNENVSSTTTAWEIVRCTATIMALELPASEVRGAAP